MSTLNDFPILYAVRHPLTNAWYFDQNEGLVRELAARTGARVERIDVAGLLAMAQAVATWADDMHAAVAAHRGALGSEAR